MSGRIIVSTIAVDCFHEADKNGIHFFTEEKLLSPLPPHVDVVYTSSYNARLLQKKCSVDAEKIKGLPLNQKLLFQDEIKKLDFYVTLIDARQKPGAVMLLFEGKDFGNILYAGKCCYSETFICRPLSEFLKSEAIDYLYVQEACDGCQSHSVTVFAAVEQAVHKIRTSPNSKVLVIEPCYREDIIKGLKDKLNENVSVATNIMEHLKETGQSSGFTLDQTSSRIFITDTPCKKRDQRNEPVLKILLIPCTWKSSKEVEAKVQKLEKKGYCVFLYKNHCSKLELLSLVKHIKAKHTVLMIQKRQEFQLVLEEREKNLDYWSHLGVGFFNSFQNMNQCLAGSINEEMDCEVDIIDLNSAEGSDGTSVIEVDKNFLKSTHSSLVLVESDVESVESKDETVINPAFLN